MFITVQIRGPVMLVRRRTGEHVSNPVHEFEDGGAHHDDTTHFDLRHRMVDPILTDLESFEIPTEVQGVGSEELLVAATTAFSGQAQPDQRRDPEKENEARRRAELDRPLALRRLLSHMHELSMLARPAKQTFVRHMNNGLAKVTLRVWRGALTIGATVQSFPGVASHLARGAAANGASARLRGEGQLRPDGSIDQLRLDVQLDALPPVGPLEQAEVDRLRATFIRLHDEGMDRPSQDAWITAHRAAAKRRPETPLLLLVAFLTDLEREALGLLGSGASRTPCAVLTLQDLLESAAQPPVTPEVDLDAQTRLVWIDDETPALDIPGSQTDQLDRLNVVFRRILAYLPCAWSDRRVPGYAH